jgi:integrase
VPESCKPTSGLGKAPKEYPRERVLSADEIRTFWHGLDRTDLPYDRKTCLALKFALVTMLRSGELIPAHRNELKDLSGAAACFNVPAERVKKRRVIQQPLSDLAVEIITEALEREDQQFVFESPVYPGQPIDRHALATALRGRPDKGTPGLCELFGVEPFTPHDLRRTAATWAGDLGCSEAAIAKCLDHQVTRDGGEKIGRVTGVYVRSKRLDQKREVLDKIAAELRRIIAAPPLRLAA